MTGDYNNAAKGREAATTMIGNGADVIWHTADVTGLGAMQGAAAAKVKAIGELLGSDEHGPGFRRHQPQAEPRLDGRRSGQKRRRTARSRAARSGS